MTYLESLLHLNEYSKVKRIIKRYNLIEIESLSNNYNIKPSSKIISLIENTAIKLV